MGRPGHGTDQAGRTSAPGVSRVWAPRQATPPSASTKRPAGHPTRSTPPPRPRSRTWCPPHRRPGRWSRTPSCSPVARGRPTRARRHGVGGRGATAAAQRGGDGRRVAVEHVTPAQPAGHGPGRDERHDVPEQCGRRGRLGRGGRRHGTRHALRVLVGDLGGARRLVHGLLGVMGVPRPQGSDPHGRAVAPGTLAVEELAGQLPPVAPPFDLRQQVVHRCPVAASEVAVDGEGRGEGVLVDAAVFGQHGQDRAGHLRVVGPLPHPWRQFPALQPRQVRGHEEL